MKRIDTIIIGAGQAGLAMSRALSDRGIEHMVLERGQVAERWRSERWDSLRFLTPRWQSRLPGWSYRGPEPDGFMTRSEIIGYLDDYARAIAAPVLDGVRVTEVAPVEGGYFVATDRGAWRARNVVIATGHCDKPYVPDFASGLSPDVAQIMPTRYRNPSQLDRGGVLVVGASATGVQLAAEIYRSGRPVTLAVGRHTRLPRSYRGRDIMEWFDAIGLWDERYDQVRDIEHARRAPSLQLVGSDARHDLDMNTLMDLGVRLVGRATKAAGTEVSLADDLALTTCVADVRLEQLLDRIDAHIAAAGLEQTLPPRTPLRRVAALPSPEKLDLAAEGIRTVLWATGYRRDYGWLHVPVLDERGEIRHDGGVTPAPGLYVLGLAFLRRRNSSFLDGVGRDAQDLADHLERRLDGPGRLAA